MNLELLVRKLRYLCAVRGFSQRELTSRMSSSATTITDLFSGRKDPAFRVLEKAAAALEVPLAVLVHEGTLDELEPYKVILDMGMIPQERFPRHRKRGIIDE